MIIIKINFTITRQSLLIDVFTTIELMFYFNLKLIIIIIYAVKTDWLKKNKYRPNIIVNNKVMIKVFTTNNNKKQQYYNW